MRALFTQPPEKQHKGVHTQSLYLTMRDGTLIAVDVLLPTGYDPRARLPVVLTMTRYWRSFELRMPGPRNRAPIAPRESLADDLVMRGFAMVIVDARGSGASTGVSRHPWTPEEIADYGEVAVWAVAQPWCSGKVGAVGISYEGTTAQLVAATGVEAVKAIVPQQVEFDLYTDVAFPGGILNEAFVKAWSEGNELLDSNKVPKWFPLPRFARWMVKGVRPVDSDRTSRATLAKALRDHQANTRVYMAMSQITFRDDLFGHTGTTLDAFSVFTHKAAIEASGSAIFIWGSWLDGSTADTVVRTFNTFSNPQIAVIGAWSHEKDTHGSPYTKPRSKADPDQAQQWAAIAQFFEHAQACEASPGPYRTYKRRDAAPLPRGVTVDLAFGLMQTSVLIRRGHRIRVAIAGADQDTFARVPTTAVPSLQISRSRNLASCIHLPVVS